MNTGKVATRGASTFGTVAVAMVTPFTAEGEIDIDAGVRLAHHLVDHGCDALILAGTTGESPTTTTAEKLALLRAVRESLPDDIRLVAGASTNNTHASVELARASAEAGASALLAVTPYYSKPSQEGVYRHFMAMADATDLPVCLYDIPSRSAIPIASDTIRRLAEHRNIQAMKDAKGDIAAAIPLIAETGLAWYSGDDPLNLPWLSVGATGFISVLGHIVPHLLREIHTCFEEGDLARAREINATVSPLFAAQARLGGVSLAKAALGIQGIDVGEPRLPQVPADPQQLEELRHDLEKVGVLTI
ncbi:4-hydroxy-tetrahydrodipicolinate synthase [Corynebacterium sp.]|uniref:4-hydroxy-tetrahydrodipicolinate synthase n=1 Tax=Corynebacterium sp. TaxID=1720 RepID=UPI0026DCC41E|nr:4-hydroxy-tetrahydrodipicolinate synthase [Corynebacterium sp.]MDO5075736.1 4-hydroxy-tetrahydrodipicolinate synthase [Corynebacterium sp.]